MKVTNIYAVGRNYVSHAKEMGYQVPEEPILFQKSSACLTNDPIIKISSKREIHHEIEIVVQIKKSGFQISQKCAMDHIGGFCLGLDLTDRQLQYKLKEKRLPWFLSKSFSGSAVITKFEPPEPGKWNQDFWLKINGRTTQIGNIRNMIFNIPTLIEYLSARFPLLNGDLIFTGTPEGVGPLKNGDELVLGLGNEIKGRFQINHSTI